MENLLYTPKIPEGLEQGDINVDEWLGMIEENQKRIAEIDKASKEQETILCRFLYEHVLDGFGIYQITKINKKTCQIKYCTTDGFNEYQVPQWGEKATIPLQYVVDSLACRDYMDNIRKKENADSAL